MGMFTLPGRKTIAGLAVAGMVLVGGMGTALADQDTTTGATRYQQFTERLASLLSKQPDEVRNAITQVHNQYIDEAVAAGTIPADKAQELKDRAATGGVPFLGGGPGFGKGHGRGHGEAGRPGGMLMGEVTKVDGQTITVKTPDGTEKTALLTAATEVRKGRDAADATAITVGARVGIHGEADAAGVVTAAKVLIHDGTEPQPGGRRGGRGPQGQAPATQTPVPTN